MDVPKLQIQDCIDDKFLRYTRLTPRSQEAFKMSGILPQEIIHPKAEHFEGPDDIIQIRLKKAAYARDQKMKVLV